MTNVYDYSKPLTVEEECEDCGQSATYVIPADHFSWVFECPHCPAAVWPSRASALY